MYKVFIVCLWFFTVLEVIACIPRIVKLKREKRLCKVISLIDLMCYTALGIILALTMEKAEMFILCIANIVIDDIRASTSIKPE